MPKANPKAWFPSHFTARISHKKVDAWARRFACHSPYFDTWVEAHEALTSAAKNRVERAALDLARAQREVVSAAKHLEKVKAMEAPAPQAEQGGDGPGAA